jgi:aminobenzoyl-glutamate transport protein
VRRIKKNKLRELHPIMAYVLLIIGTIILSGFLHLIDAQGTYNKINSLTYELVPKTEVVTSLFNLSGLKYIFVNTVSNFANFAVLANLIIVLMGISIMDKSGFLQTAITITTKKMKKTTVTFIFVLLCVISSLFGELSYLIFIPLGALLFYYGKRNPAIGIIAAFAAVSCGTGINIFFTSSDSALLEYTKLASASLNSSYSISRFPFFFIMIIAVILVSYIITIITENIIVKKLPKYEFTEQELEEDIVTEDERKGMIYACSAAIVYLVIFIYNIIPNLPLSGALLDNSQILYVDKLFSVNSFFRHGFVFIVTILLILVGLFYGIGVKTIKNHQDFCDNLGHSLDGIGNVLVMIFLASAFISIFKHTNIGNVLLSGISSLISNSGFTGIPLIILVFFGIIVATIFVPSSIIRWSILSSSVVSTMMNAGLTPQFAQIVFRFAETSVMNITPLLAYFIVYLAFLEKYNQNEKKIRLFESIKYQIPYTIVIGLTLLVLIIVWYIIGLPLGISSYPTL